MTNNFDIDPIVGLALDKVKGKLFRDKVTSGEYSDVVTVDVSYKLKIGEDYTQRCNPKVPWKALALCLASKVNEETFDAVLRIALDQEDGRKELELATKPLVDTKIAALVSSKNMSYKGKVTGEVHVTQAQVMSLEQESEAVTK